MKRFKNWLKIKFRTWLQIDICEQNLDIIIKTINSNNDKTTKEFLEFNKKISIIHNEINNNINQYQNRLSADFSQLQNSVDVLHNTIKNVVNIGTDVYRENSGHSWAVVCIEGNMNIVKLIDLDRRNAQEILGFLKHFEAGRHCIDAPYKEMFYKGLFKF